MLRYSVSKWTLQTCHPFCPCSDTAEQLVWMLASSHALFNRLLKVACSQIKEIELCRIPFTVLKTLLRSTVLSWHLYLGTRQTLIGMGIAGMLCKEMAVFPIFSLYLLGVMLERPKLWWRTIYQTTTANHVAAKLLCWETEQFSFSKINSHCFYDWNAIVWMHLMCHKGSVWTSEQRGWLCFILRSQNFACFC